METALGSLTASALPASKKTRLSTGKTPTSARQRSIESAIILALSVQDALPVVRFVCPFGVGVNENLDFTAAEEALPHIKHGKILLLNHQTCEGANDRRGRAPVNQLAGRCLERRSMQRANNDVPNDVSTLAHRGSDVRAQVAHTENLPTLIFANEHIRASKVFRTQFGRSQITSLESRFDPCERRKNDLRCVTCCNLGQRVRCWHGSSPRLTTECRRLI
mmetsp:Transcript_124800/g.186439  ORF Transcript_124800/g.186439 Transcript_124800/m.186439 type:complete len:220 (+) Transcript_124800:2-661(+)